MAGCCDGFDVSASFIVGSKSPFAEVTVAPDVLALALEGALQTLRFTCPDENGKDEEHTILEAHVHHVGASLSSMRNCCGKRSPWTDPDTGLHIDMRKRGFAVRRGVITFKGPVAKRPAAVTKTAKRTTRRTAKRTGRR